MGMGRLTAPSKPLTAEGAEGSEEFFVTLIDSRFFSGRTLRVFSFFLLRAPLCPLWLNFCFSSCRTWQSHPRARGPLLPHATPAGCWSTSSNRRRPQCQPWFGLSGPTHRIVQCHSL